MTRKAFLLIMTKQDGLPSPAEIGEVVAVARQAYAAASRRSYANITTSS